MENFVTGACAVGAAIAGAAGAVALANWAFSESDEQVIARISHEASSINLRYGDMMRYCEKALGVYDLTQDWISIFNSCTESVLFDTATVIWNSGTSQQAYRSQVSEAKNQLQSALSLLIKRIHSLERKHCGYEEQKRLNEMRKLLRNVQELTMHVNFLADFLVQHKTYFNLYHSVGVIRNKNVGYFAIVESNSPLHLIEYNLKQSILCSYSGRYPFTTFVNLIEADIAALKADIYALDYNYASGRQYAHLTLDQLVWMKNLVITDARYQQELYDWEQARLQQLHIEALAAQARADREHAHLMREQQHRMLDQNNRLRQQELLHRGYSSYAEPVDVNVTVDINL